MMKKVRVLHVMGGLWCGGTESYVMNMFRSIDREKVQFEFLIHERAKAHYDDEVLSLGGRIYRIPDRTEIGTIRYLWHLIWTLKQIRPDIIHAHAMFNAGVVMLAAFLVGIRKRVCHSHSTDDQAEFVGLSRKLFQFIMRLCVQLFSTDYAACSETAAQFLFGSKRVEAGEVRVINNGINLSKFLEVETQKVDIIRRELQISENRYVIGLVSRLVEVKNPLFFIGLLEKLCEVHKDIMVVVVGEGPLKPVIEEEVSKRNLGEHVRLTGNRDDVHLMMSIFDIFMLPSFFEGLGIVAIEAQARGVPCLLSEKVPLRTDLGLGLVQFLPLDDEQRWIDAIEAKPSKLNDIHQIKKIFHQKGYDSLSSSNQLLKVYGI
ncbi:glycosyltransferase family 1 protein [Paenibacillus aurantius]|uniref:Glycosyltransferase family 1 protein n=1 Tax=Paenibacillus aurantius TaxID=2918900 RepID=A0AA96RG53_9BACL|nr:glycosyltransferase family 1 protein [Paenibacillus aurantius]WNQ12702.1 glycosyltransferase family 1 protein [Paenibacillus aurantius]